MSIHLVLFQPDIAGNTGTIARMAACLNLTLHIIEPAGFDTSDRAFKRAGMDYLLQTHLIRHTDWESFLKWTKQSPHRLIILTTKSSDVYTKFTFQPGDLLLLGRESAGLPDYVHQNADARLTIPMTTGARSLNLAVSAAMVVGEAVRQLNG